MSNYKIEDDDLYKAAKGVKGAQGRHVYKHEKGHYECRCLSCDGVCVCEIPKMLEENEKENDKLNKEIKSTRRVKELEEKINVYTTEIGELKETIKINDQLTTEISRHHDNVIEELECEIQSLKAKILEQGDKLNMAKEYYARLHTRYIDLYNKFQVKRLEKENAKLEKENAKLEKDLNNWKSISKRAVKQQNKAAEAYAEAAEKLAVLNEENAVLKKENNDLVVKVIDMEAREIHGPCADCDKDKRISELEDWNDKIQDENEKLEKELEKKNL